MDRRERGTAGQEFHVRGAVECRNVAEVGAGAAASRSGRRRAGRPAVWGPGEIAGVAGRPALGHPAGGAAHLEGGRPLNDRGGQGPWQSPRDSWRCNRRSWSNRQPARAVRRNWLDVDAWPWFVKPGPPVTESRLSRLKAWHSERCVPAETARGRENRQTHGTDLRGSVYNRVETCPPRRISLF
jgi:hypothetical protein